MPGEASLSGQIALVTGASRGIGAATARALAAAGAHVILVARTARDLETVEQAIFDAGGTATLGPDEDRMPVMVCGYRNSAMAEPSASVA